MSQISINTESVDQRAAALKIASDNFENRTINPIDEESTISAIQNGQRAFQEAVQGHHLLGQALSASSAQIKEIGSGFAGIDSHAANTMGFSGS